MLADISAASFQPAAARHPERVLNLGIREQLMIGVAGGLALTGYHPIVHVGASYDGSEYGFTHFSPGDVALLDTLTGWTVHRRVDLRRYGRPADHARWHGLDPAGLRRSLVEFQPAGPGG